MKTPIRELIASILAYALGLYDTRKIVLSKDQESATLNATSKTPYIRDSKDTEKGETREDPPAVHYNVYSKEHVHQLRKAFPQKRWSTTTSEAELAFNAGQQSVMDNIEKRLTNEGLKTNVLS